MSLDSLASAPAGSVAGLLALAIGAFSGLRGALRNRVGFADERLLWALGGALGALAATRLGLWLLPTAGPFAGTLVWLALSLVATSATPAFDAGTRGRAIASLVLKILASPVSSALSLVGLLAARARGARVDLAHGALFVSAGRGGAAVVIGAVVWAQDALWEGDRIAEPWALHEAHHTRTIASLGEIGFYAAYLLVGAPWSLLRGAPWNALDARGRGHPFERTAYRLSDAASERLADEGRIEAPAEAMEARG